MKYTPYKMYVLYAAFLFWPSICIDGAFVDRSTPTTALDGAILILCLYNVDTLKICMKEFGGEKIIFDKMTAVRTKTIFP